MTAQSGKKRPRKDGIKAFAANLQSFARSPKEREAATIYLQRSLKNTDIVNQHFYIGKKQTTPLCYAADQGNLELVNMLLNADANVESTNGEGLNALDLATRSGRVEIVEALLKKGEYHNPEIAKASDQLKSVDNIDTRLEILQNLKGHLSDRSEKRNKITVDIDSLKFLKNLSEGNVKEARKTLRKNPKMANLEFEDEHGSTNPICYAASQGNRKMVDMLLSKGADPRKRDGMGRNALEVAAETGEVQVMELLLMAQDKWKTRHLVSAGQLLRALNNEAGLNALTAIKQALTNRMQWQQALSDPNASVSLKIERQIKRTRVQQAISKFTSAIADGNAKKAQECLKKSRDLANMSEPSTGITPLMYACQRGYSDVVRVLLANRANIDAQDKGGRTALMHAVICGQEAIVTALLAAGADINKQTNSKSNPRTAFGLACDRLQRNKHDPTGKAIAKSAHDQDEAAETKTSLARHLAIGLKRLYVDLPREVAPKIGRAFGAGFKKYFVDTTAATAKSLSRQVNSLFRSMFNSVVSRFSNHVSVGGTDVEMGPINRTHKTPSQAHEPAQSETSDRHEKTIYTDPMSDEETQSSGFGFRKPRKPHGALAFASYPEGNNTGHDQAIELN